MVAAVCLCLVLVGFWKRLRSFDSSEVGAQFLFSCGVAVDGEGNILIAHNGSHIIQQYTAEGQFLKAVGARGSGPLQFFFPTGLMYSLSNKKVYVVDAGNCRVQILNSDLTFSSLWKERQWQWTVSHSTWYSL